MHTIGTFTQKACDVTFNLVETDLNLENDRTLAMSIPLFNHKDEMGQKLDITDENRFGMMIWEMDIEKYFQEIY